MMLESIILAILALMMLGFLGLIIILDVVFWPWDRDYL